MPALITGGLKPEEEIKEDVVIVGAGPAGLMLANALKSAGVDVRVIDERYVLGSRYFV